MKKKLFYITGVCALLALQTACSPQFEDLFDKSASERLEEAMDDAESVLTAADKGWAMGYFPNTETRGYVLFAKFNTDGTVTLTDYNNGGLSSTSTYSMNTSQGPVLNFDTYSEVLGRYTDPGTWLGGSTGNAGDFEFVIFSVNEDEVILKGKKYHAKVVLRKITGDGDQETLWRQHYDACEVRFLSLFSNVVDPLLKVGNVFHYTLTTPMTRVFTMFPYGSTNPEEATNLSFVATVDGIDFSSELEVGNGVSCRSFVYNAAENALVSQENADVKIVIPDVYDYFLGLSVEHLATVDRVSGTFATAFASLAAGFVERYEDRQVLESVGFSRMRDGRFAFMLKTARASAMYAIPVHVEDGIFVIDAFDAQNMQADDMDDNGALFYTNVPAVKDMLVALPGAYTLQNNGAFLLNEIEMTSVVNAENKLNLSR